METKKAKSIVFSCSINGLSIIRSLGRRGIHVVAVDYDRKALGFSSKYACECIVAPDPGVDKDEFLSFVLENSNKWAGSLLIPIQDKELAIFSYHKEELSRYHILPIPDWEATRKILDKKETYEMAARLNIPIPKTISLDSVESPDSLQNNIGYPCLLKPRISHEFRRKFGRKAFIIEDFEQLKMGIVETYKAGCEMMI